MHCSSIFIKFSRCFCIRGVTSTNMAKITTLTTLCLTRIITLHMHYSADSTCTPAPVYSFHIKVFYKCQITQFLWYYTRVSLTRKSNCVLTTRGKIMSGRRMMYQATTEIGQWTHYWWPCYHCVWLLGNWT